MMQSAYWVVIPAAGIGARMGMSEPKQYLQIGQKTVIEHTLSCFLRRSDIKGIVVVIASHDTYWQTLEVARHPLVMSVQGGASRQQSVLNGLQYVHTRAASNDWVLVHDAVRPCVREQDINTLITQVFQGNVSGGVLAVPVRDTMKRADEDKQVLNTVERENLWHALTPQMFPLGRLIEALNTAINDDFPFTDEAMAMERLGYKVLLVQGEETNIKITRPQDLSFVAHSLCAEED